MSEILTRYDAWLADDGPAALVIREPLVPVEGPDGVVFPATYAASEDKTFKGGYNIDAFADGSNVCIIDSVGSQANRIEPIFGREGYSSLVPQFCVKAGEKTISIFEAGHRAGDALLRCSELKAPLHDAFKALQSGNAEPLAKLAPTSLVFGVWDSRDTQVKAPRLIASTIRAYDVQKLTRSAQFVPATEYVTEGLLDDPGDNKKAKDAYAERGFVHVPASGSHGGVIAKGGIRRDATLHLGALRLLAAGSDGEKSLALRRYILGLALTAFTSTPENYLRQGCNLVPNPKDPRQLTLVHHDGHRKDVTLTHKNALEYAKVAAEHFDVEKGKTVDFKQELAKVDVSPDRDGKAAAKAAKKAK